jgi:hypothetical protein
MKDESSFVSGANSIISLLLLLLLLTSEVMALLVLVAMACVATLEVVGRWVRAVSVLLLVLLA